MIPTADELAALLDRLANTSKTLAEADQQRAGAEKTRADAELVRAQAEEAGRLAQHKLDAAAADVDTKVIANQKARSDAEQARIDKLIAQLSGAVPDLSSLPKSSVTFSEGKVLRQGEAIGLALSKVAAEVAAKVEGALQCSDGGRPVLFVMSDAKIVAHLAGYWQIKGEADLLKTRFDEAEKAGNAALAASRKIATRMAVAPGTGLAVATMAGKALTQVASLFELEVAVTTAATDISAQTVQAAVIGKLLELSPGLVVHHQWTRVPLQASVLRIAVGDLIDLDIKAAQLSSRLATGIKALGDPAARLASAQKDAADKNKTPQERADAEQRVVEAEQDIKSLTGLKQARDDLNAVVQKALAFAERVTKVSDKTGESPLTLAFSVEPLTAQQPPHVLVLEGAKAECQQLLIKRRVFAPRLQVSAAVGVDYFLVRGEGLLACGHASAAASYHGKITGGGASWQGVAALGSASSA